MKKINMEQINKLKQNFETLRFKIIRELSTLSETKPIKVDTILFSVDDTDGYVTKNHIVKIDKDKCVTDDNRLVSLYDISMNELYQLILEIKNQNHG